MKLYGYFRSSAAFRVRIALNLKRLSYEQAPIHLRRNEQQGATYRALNPQGLVPTLDDNGTVLTQSLAIIEYLDETHPQPPLLPAQPVARARVRALALAVACDIHPIDNLRVLRYLAKPLGHGDAAIEDWFNHWIRVGFEAIERRIAGEHETGAFCHGDTPTLADICLASQVIAAVSYFDCDVKSVPTAMRIYGECLKLDAFDRSQPHKQPDAPANPSH